MLVYLCVKILNLFVERVLVFYYFKQIHAFIRILYINVFIICDICKFNIIYTNIFKCMKKFIVTIPITINYLRIFVCERVGYQIYILLRHIIRFHSFIGIKFLEIKNLFQ